MAQRLAPIRLRELGTLGFFAESDELDDRQYAATLGNAVFDQKGRIAARKGWLAYLTSAVTDTPDIEKLHYYAKEIGETEYWIAAGDNDKLYKLSGAVGTGTATDITGAITTPSDSNWQFVNYNNLVVGMQQDDNPISWNGTGNFADYGSGTALPDGNCLLSAWGRLFGTTADGQQINWTATLGSDFDAVGAGQLNVRLVWPDGKDKIVAIAAFNSRLVIFGQRSVLIYGDDAKSQLDAGLDPNSTSFGLKETVDGVGLYARDLVAQVGNDLVFCSPAGLRTLRRAVDYENHAMAGVSHNVNAYLLDTILSDAPSADACNLTFDQSRGLLLLRLGTKYVVFDARRTWRDPNKPEAEPFYRASLWTGIPWKGIAVGDDKALRLGFADGLIGEYTGYLDNNVAYTFDLSTVWLSLERGQGQGERLKFLKRILLFASTTKNYEVTMRWLWDFSTTKSVQTITMSQQSPPSEWGLGEWGLSEWNGGNLASIFKGTASGKGSGTFLKLGFSVEIDGTEFAYNSINTQLKLGRLTR